MTTLPARWPGGRWSTVAQPRAGGAAAPIALELADVYCEFFLRHLDGLALPAWEADPPGPLCYRGPACMGDVPPERREAVWLGIPEGEG